MKKLLGRSLYHGTGNVLIPNGFPTMKEGNWFSTNPNEARLHAVLSSKTDYGLLYVYKVIKEPNIIKFDTVKEFNSYANEVAKFVIRKTWAFSENDKHIAIQLCKKGIYDGWWFPMDQSQVMLCNPKKFLRLVKILHIDKPRGAHRPTFKRNNKGARLVKHNDNKFKATPITLNNVFKLVNTRLWSI